MAPPYLHHSQRARGEARGSHDLEEAHITFFFLFVYHWSGFSHVTTTAARGRLGNVVFILCGYRSSQKSEEVLFLQEKGRMDMRGDGWSLPQVRRGCVGTGILHCVRTP